MPLFEYHCEPCNTDFELLVRSGETAACPECGQVELERLFSAPAAPVMSSGSLPMASACPPPIRLISFCSVMALLLNGTMGRTIRIAP